MDEHGAELLTLAIVRRAAADYKLAVEGRLPSKWNVEEIEKFFKGNYFELLMPNIDGKAVFEQIKLNYVTHGITVFDTEDL